MQSVVQENTWGGAAVNDLDFVMYYAQKADEFGRWGASPRARDRQLRAFWPTESLLASTMFTTVARYAAFGWALNGPKATVDRYAEVLNLAQFGMGWENFVIRFLIDLFSQDNGAFIEIVRLEDDEASPCVGINHLDSARCIPTGIRKQPVDYIDIHGQIHHMKAYQVLHVTEMPSPIESARGMQYCAVTRLLQAAKIMQSLSTYKHEKVSGRRHHQIHIVNGIHRKTLLDAMTQHEQEANAEGLTRYIQPLIVPTLDPTSNVGLASIDLASLPDNFDEDTAFKWYIAQLALAFGADYQDFAPLPGGNLGTAQQSEVLHLKGRGKGPALFMQMLEHLFAYQGVLPRNVHFSYGDQDVAESASAAEAKKRRAETREIQIRSGEITPQVARQIALDQGDLNENYLKLMNEANATPDVIVSSSGRQTG